MLGVGPDWSSGVRPGGERCSQQEWLRLGNDCSMAKVTRAITRK
jgi:hypothetical protein